MLIYCYQFLTVLYGRSPIYRYNYRYAIANYKRKRSDLNTVIEPLCFIETSPYFDVRKTPKDVCRPSIGVFRRL